MVVVSCFPPYHLNPTDKVGTLAKGVQVRGDIWLRHLANGCISGCSISQHLARVGGAKSTGRDHHLYPARTEMSGVWGHRELAAPERRSQRAPKNLRQHTT